MSPWKDDARYVVDVAVAPVAVVPRSKPSSVWNEISNQDLITFMEAKALVVYRMLVAQFIGIVHETQPRFPTGRRAPGFRAAGHFDPSERGPRARQRAPGGTDPTQSH